VYVRHVSDDAPEDPELADIHPALAPASGEPIIDKRFGSAFLHTGLEAALAALGVKTLYVCGLATFGRVNATVMCAVCKGYETMVVNDAHGTQGFPDATPSQVIERFNAVRECAGETLRGSRDARF